MPQHLDKMVEIAPKLCIICVHFREACNSIYRIGQFVTDSDNF